MPTQCKNAHEPMPTDVGFCSILMSIFEQLEIFTNRGFDSITTPSFLSSEAKTS